MTSTTMDCSISSINSPPEEFVCPISMNLMNNPVRSTKTNHCFEREDIMNWIYLGHTQCPLTRTSIHPEDFVLDTKLQAEILKWKISKEFNDSSLLETKNSLDDSDADFDATLQDILEITNRIKTVALDNNNRRSSPSRNSAPSSLPSRVVTPAAPSQPTSRLSDIRLRVLQRRDDRIKTMLSKDQPQPVSFNKKTVAETSSEDNSLANFMAARI